MKKIIAVLVVLLLAVSSAQALTVLMDENFDSADDHVDLDTLPKWTNNNGSDTETIFTSYPDIEPVDSGRGIHKYGYPEITEFDFSWYEYEINAAVTLGAGEYYRYESFWHVTDGPINDNAYAVTRRRHTDDRVIQWTFDAGEATWKPGYMELSIWTGYWWESGVEIKSINLPVSNTPMIDVRVRIDVNAAGVTAWYNPGEAPGSGWILLGEALASEDSRLGFSGGLEAVEIELYSDTNLDWPFADTFSLIVDAPALPGDVDGSGYVDGTDRDLIIANWGKSPATRGEGDLNNDNAVTGLDYTEVITYWNTGTPGEPGAIPEPATICLLALAGTVLLAGRRR